MSDVPSAEKKVQIEAVRTRGAGSEAIMQTIGGSVNWLIDRIGSIAAKLALTITSGVENLLWTAGPFGLSCGANEIIIFYTIGDEWGTVVTFSSSQAATPGAAVDTPQGGAILTSKASSTSQPKNLVGVIYPNGSASIIAQAPGAMVLHWFKLGGIDLTV